MKKILSSILFAFISILAHAQDDGINIKDLHAPDGKQWVLYNSPDGYQAPEGMKDDIFIFYSDGTFKIDEGTIKARELTGFKTKKWSFDDIKNIISWDITFANGTTKKYSGEISYLDSERCTIHLSENGKDNYIFVLLAK